MSRGAAAADQLTTPSRHIFMTEITQADGTKKVVISAQSLSDKSIRISAHDYLVPIHLLMILMQLPESNLNPFISNINRFAQPFRKLPSEILTHLFSYISPVNTLDELRNVGGYATAVRKPSLFPQLKINSSFVVDAAMRGQEDMVMHILRADPSYLLRSANVKNSVDVESIRTPLQAAIMANDVQLAEKMREHFARIPNGDVIMQRQILQIYKESLTTYYEKQAALVDHLIASQTAGETIDEAALSTARERRNAYETALRSDNILDIVDAHDKAQEHNAFDFQPYVDAIINARTPAELAELDGLIALINAKTPEETAAACARTGVAACQTPEAHDKAFDELTLVEKLNRFREELVKHMQPEIILNPHHILAGLKINEAAWNDFDAGRLADPEYKKLSVIFSDLVGEAQRVASEPVKQDTRQGTYYLTEENEPRSRPSCFNTWDSVNSKIVRNSLVDVSLINASSVDGLGYKFAGAGGARAGCWGGARARTFQNLCRAKTASFQNLLRNCHQHAMRAGV